MKGLWSLMILVLVPAVSFAITAEEIIRRVDDNQVFQSEKGRAVMVINRDGRILKKEFTVVGVREGDKFFMEYLNPEDRGTKYLKINDELWIYLPDADDVMKISGHMLRQGMMGSDLSFEDLLSADDYASRYESRLSGETNYRGSRCYVIEMTARSNAQDIAYYRQEILVDVDRMVALSLRLYARSGRLLKTMEQFDIRSVGGKNVAYKIEIRDTRRENSVTTIEFSELAFDVPVPRGIFSRQNLKK